MTPAQLTAWIHASQLLVSAAVPVVSLLHDWLTRSHPQLTPDQINAAYVAILTDDAMRIAFAERAGMGG